jgi:hypothetical protein
MLLGFYFNGYRKWRHENLVQYDKEVDHKVYLNSVYGYYFYASNYKYGDDAKLLGYIWQIKRVLKPCLSNNVFKKIK